MAMSLIQCDDFIQVVFVCFSFFAHWRCLHPLSIFVHWRILYSGLQRMQYMMISLFISVSLFTGGGSTQVGKEDRLLRLLLRGARPSWSHLTDYPLAVLTEAQLTAFLCCNWSCYAAPSASGQGVVFVVVSPFPGKRLQTAWCY